MSLYTQRGPEHLQTTAILRRLDVGEHRQAGDFYLSYGERLEPVEAEWISTWRPWRNRVNGLMCPHYRITRMTPVTPIS
jgi:hypothetical protein